MVEQKRTQLFLMLVQQAGIGSLPLSFLTRAELLNFMRKLEQSACQERSPIFVYWSSRDSHWLLPESHTRLRRDALCVAMFSEERDDKQEEFTFIVESQGLCLVLYGYRSEEHNGDVFQCVGSFDPELVRRSFQMMLPMWQFLDLGETNRLEEARNNAGPPTTSAKLAQDVRAMWAVNKSPSPALYQMQQTDSGDRLPVPPFKGTNTLTKLPPRPSVADQLRSGTVVPSNIDFGAPENYMESAFASDAVIASTELLGPTVMTPPAGTPAADDVSFVRADVATTPRPKGKRDSKTSSLRDLRQKEVWTTISEESRDVFPPDAQRIIRDIMGQLRHSSEHSRILQFAIEELCKIAHADRGLVWQVVGDQLNVTHEFSLNGETPFVGTKLSSNDSTEIVSEFLSRFPDETGTGVIAIPDIEMDKRLHKVSPALYSMIELAGVRARVVAQLRCIGRFHGFLELQQSSPRDWSEQEASLLQSISETLSIVVQQAFDLDRREMDANEMKLINTISDMFRESRGQRVTDTLSRSVKLVADHMGFVHSQVYLLSEQEKMLRPQISNNGQLHPVSMTAKDNPFVQVFEGKGKIRIINAEYSRKGDPYFAHDMALVVALESEGETLGVLGLWGRNDKNGRQFRPGEDPKLAQTICNNLASIVRADQAIAQIRTDRERKEVINRVTGVIKDNANPKDLDKIFEEMVNAVCEHLHLSLCGISLFDANNEAFIKSKMAGELQMPKNVEPSQFVEELFHSVLPEINNVPILEPDDLQQLLGKRGLVPPAEARLVTVVPVSYQEKLKAAMCLVSAEDHSVSLDDMNLIQDLAGRLAADISHKELFEQVERQAVTDPMTGLYNRRHFGEQLSKEIDRNQRFGHPFSYIILDLDFLKKINDSLGHQFGDAAIKHIANVVKKCVRDVDTTARYGGEEFVVLLPETDVQGARVVAERMCYAIRELPVEGIGTVTASIGVATFPYDAQDRDKLTELADQALYLAKHRGRNQVCSVSEDLLPTLSERGEDALEIQKATIKAKAEELASIDLKLVAEYGLLGILGAVMKMIEAKDAYANDRSPRAADYAARLAGALHLSKEHTTVISLAAILHNIGKIAISEDILQKKEALTEEERKIIESSPVIGAKILEPAKHLHRVASVVESYHEHWDGTGYPKGLRGEQIPLESRIIALIDAYVAMTSDRPYRGALSTQEAANLLQQGAGKEWDPRLVKLFLGVLNKEAKV